MTERKLMAPATIPKDMEMCKPPKREFKLRPSGKLVRRWRTRARRPDQKLGPITKGIRAELQDAQGQGTIELEGKLLEISQ